MVGDRIGIGVLSSTFKVYMSYKIYDTRDKIYLLRTYKSFYRAKRQADKLDLEYGAVRYIVMWG
jgi:hypothetical protein